MKLYLFLDDLWINESWILNLDNGSRDEHSVSVEVNCDMMDMRQWYQSTAKLNPHPLLSQKTWNS